MLSSHWPHAWPPSFESLPESDVAYWVRCTSLTLSLSAGGPRGIYDGNRPPVAVVIIVDDADIVEVLEAVDSEG